MIMRVVVAGCRDYNDYCEAKVFIDSCLADIRNKNKIIIVSGCANGTDALGERYALENGFEIERFPAQWGKYGKSAGPKRNRKMAAVADLVICFWDGKSRGTRSKIENAEKCGKDIRVKMICIKKA